MEDFMNTFLCLLGQDLRRRSKDGFFIGYNIIFPMILTVILGYLTSESYGNGFTGYQYYSIVTLPFCIALSIITAAYAAKEEAYKKTAVRFLFTPISRVSLILSRLLYCTIILSCCNLVVLLFSKLVLKLPIGDDFLQILLLLLTLSFAVCGVGLFIGYGIKNFIMVKNIINIPVMAAGILAGSFYPFGTLSPTLETAISLSPLTWINRSIFCCIYDGNTGLLWITIPVCLFVGFVCTVMAVLLFKKEEYIHGVLPGYEK
jgi:ABC-2 type transport system permease protein